MNTTFRNLSALATAFSMSMAISPAYSQEKGKAKAKGKEKTGTNGKHGREAGELPYGLERSHGEKRRTSIRIAKKER